MFDISLWTIADTIKGDLNGFVRDLLVSAPSRFWTDPASSTGKYHPDYDNGREGLVRHTVVVAAACVDGCRRYGREDLRDVVVAAALCHDLWKNGTSWGDWTITEHGAIAGDKMLAMRHEYPDVSSEIDMAAYAVTHHYGIWCQPKPWHPFRFTTMGEAGYGEAALILQEADYYSSRSYLGEPDEAALREVLGCVTDQENNSESIS